MQSVWPAFDRVPWRYRLKNERASAGRLVAFVAWPFVLDIAVRMLVVVWGLQLLQRRRQQRLIRQLRWKRRCLVRRGVDLGSFWVLPAWILRDEIWGWTGLKKGNYVVWNEVRSFLLSRLIR